MKRVAYPNETAGVSKCSDRAAYAVNNFYWKFHMRLKTYEFPSKENIL